MGIRVAMKQIGGSIVTDFLFYFILQLKICVFLKVFIYIQGIHNKMHILSVKVDEF